MPGEDDDWLNEFEEYITYTESNEYIWDKIMLIEDITEAEAQELYDLWFNDTEAFWEAWREAMGY